MKATLLYDRQEWTRDAQGRGGADIEYKGDTGRPNAKPREPPVRQSSTDLARPSLRELRRWRNASARLGHDRGSELAKPPKLDT